MSFCLICFNENPEFLQSSHVKLDIFFIALETYFYQDIFLTINYCVMLLKETKHYAINLLIDCPYTFDLNKKFGN